MGNCVSEEGHPIGVPFGHDPENHINHCDRAELANIRGTQDLGDEGHNPIIEAPKVHGARIKFFEQSHDLRLDGRPERLKERHGQAIRTRGRGGFHPLNGCEACKIRTPLNIFKILKNLIEKKLRGL